MEIRRSISVVLRLIAALILGNDVTPYPGIADQGSYHNLAMRVLDGHGFSFGRSWWPATGAGEPTAHWSFLYTLFVTAVYAVFGISPVMVRIIQAIAVGILMPWLIYRIVRRLFSGENAIDLSKNESFSVEAVALLAAAIMSIYSYFVYYAAALMTESFYITAILWSLDIALQIRQAESEKVSPQRWLLLGFALGITVLLRQLFIMFVPFLLLWLWWASRPKLRYLLLPLLLIVAMILPWTIRNYLAFDQVVLLNTNSGFAFFWGNHPIHGTHFMPILPPEMGSYYSLIPPELLTLNEAELESALMGLAVDQIAADPGRYLLLSISRIPPYFTFWPTPNSNWLSNLARLISFGLFLPFMLYGLSVTLGRRHQSVKNWLAAPMTLLYIFMLFYAGVHILTWTLIRYRLPIDALLLIFAGLGLYKIGRRFNWWSTKDFQLVSGGQR